MSRAEAEQTMSGPRVLRPGRAAVLAAGGLLLLLFLATLVFFVARAVDHPEVVVDDWSAEGLRAALVGLGLPAGALVGYIVFLQLLVVVASVVAALYLLRGPVMSRFRLYLGFVLVFNATAGSGLLSALARLYPGHDWLNGLEGLSWFLFFPLAYLFPDGRFVPRWSRWLAVAWAVLFVVTAVVPDGPPVTVPLILLLVSCAAAQIYRFRWVSSAVERQQTKWVLIALVLQLGHIATGRPPVESPRGLVLDLALALFSYAISVALPVAIAIAIARYRLYDVDLLISRTLVYVTLTVLVIGIYVVVVGGFGALWRIDGNPLLPLAATGLVAVAFNPLRQWVQRAVNRLVWGDRDDPHAVMTRLARRLGSAMPPEGALQTIVDTIGAAMKLPYVSVTLAGGSATAVYETGGVPEQTAAYPLRYRDEEVGVLMVSPRPGESFGTADRRALEEIAGHAGVAVQALRSTADLQRSRERIVAAREEERARLHRDLHDGLGPTLASLYQRIDAARALLARDPDSAYAVLDQAGKQVKATVEDVRQLVYGLRPPVLAELGLAAAVEEACRGLAPWAVVEIAEDLPSLPAGVEVAAYRIAVEAVTNVVRHAEASSCLVRFVGEEGALVVSVRDDGVGIGADARPGAGLRSMRERAEELVGTLSISPVLPRGTLVTARLPLGTGEQR
ncbi:GAF domain-containing sensor histidine kinase [Kribbella sp. NPDC051718]|uniref:sensor histidine kinase n=1 Tax=Kribbella sp. NPDC051718 TaxID=3155168 RepID=UPI0034488FDD